MTRHWLITGVSGGLGRALAEAALGRGDVVVGTLRDEAQAASFEQRAPGRSFAVLLDVTDGPQIVSQRASEAVRRAGHLDILVNNAGYGLLGAVEEVSEEELRHQMETNFFGPLHLIRALLPHFRERGDGHIVNVSSIAGFSGQAGLGLYNASKFALEGLSEALQHELRSFGIPVTLIEPGAFRTDWAGKGLRRAAERLSVYAALAEAGDSTMSRLDGEQQGDPGRAAAAIIAAVESAAPPRRLPLGSDAVAAVRNKLEGMERELKDWQGVALSTDYPDRRD
ncbi:oxidoreductase [Streptomyces sp. NPDC005803]|uniref:oxidoreductase n=1 Tax=Streptomyces sp. NPDC005803 TaxID=3154297 RepID=UPI0033F88601